MSKIMKIGIIGLGLIGGSIALKLKEVNMDILFLLQVLGLERVLRDD